MGRPKTRIETVLCNSCNKVIAKDIRPCELRKKKHLLCISCYNKTRISPVRIVPDDIENGILLCKPCHYQIKNKEKQYIELFNEIVVKNTALRILGA